MLFFWFTEWGVCSKKFVFNELIKGIGKEKNVSAMQDRMWLKQ